MVMGIWRRIATFHEIISKHSWIRIEITHSPQKIVSCPKLPAVPQFPENSSRIFNSFINRKNKRRQTQQRWPHAPPFFGPVTSICWPNLVQNLMSWSKNHLCWMFYDDSCRHFRNIANKQTNKKETHATKKQYLPMQKSRWGEVEQR